MIMEYMSNQVTGEKIPDTWEVIMKGAGNLQKALREKLISLRE